MISQEMHITATILRQTSQTNIPFEFTLCAEAAAGSSLNTNDDPRTVTHDGSQLTKDIYSFVRSQTVCFE